MVGYYNGLEFRTTLLARWAAFLDIAGWTWWANPASVGDWQPDFIVSWPCGHSECPDRHALLVSVLPVDRMKGISDHPALQHRYGVADGAHDCLADAGAVFGTSPSASLWEMSHGAGGGVESVPDWVPNAGELWHRAGDLVDRR